MAISLLDNLSIKKKAPDVARQLFDTVADMVAFSENYLPAVYECNVVADGKRYRYMSTNTVDAVTGKWREVTADSEPVWYGTSDEWDDLDKTALADGTLVYITDDSTESPLANYYNKTQTDELLDKKLDVEQTVAEAGKVALVGTDGNIKIDNVKATNVTFTNGTDTKTIQASLNQANGIPLLDANGKILASQLPTSARKIVGHVDASNVHTLPDTTDYDIGDELIIVSDGTINQSTAFTLTSGKTLTEMEVANANALILAGYVFTLSATSTLGTVKTFATNKVTLSDDTEIALPYASDLSATSTPATVPITVNTGDEFINIDSHWVHLSNTSSVTSVNSKTGAVVLSASDINITIDGTAKTIQSAVEDGDIGGGDAEQVSYTNADKSAWNNVKKALDGIIAKIYYVAPQITSFTATPSTTVYEKGSKVSSLAFAWVLNKDVTTQTLTDCTVTVDDRSATYSTEISAKKTFTLSVGDGENTASKSFTVDFQDKVYYGSSAVGTYDSDFILALATKKFATSKAGTYAVNVASGQYGYIAYPKSFGQISSAKIGGFDTDLDNCGDVSFTNASGYTSTYNIVKTGRSGLGSISMVVS